MDLTEINDAIGSGKYQLDADTNGQGLEIWKPISEVWPRPPSLSQLHIYVTSPANMGNPTPFNVPGEYFMRLSVPTQNI